MRLGPRSLAAALATLAVVAFGVAFGTARALEDDGADVVAADPTAAIASPEPVTLEDQRIPSLDPLGTLPSLRRRPPPPPAIPAPRLPSPTPAAPSGPAQPSTPAAPAPSAPDTGVEDFE